MRLRLGLSLSLLLVAMPLAAQHAYISSQAANKITVLDIDTQKINYENQMIESLPTLSYCFNNVHLSIGRGSRPYNK